jgi:hypothetical protein
MTQVDHIANRAKILAALREEIVGPKPVGEPIDVLKELWFESVPVSRRPFRQKETGEEILTRDRPCKRYGAGVLFPVGICGEDGGDGTAAKEEAIDPVEEEISPEPAEPEESMLTDRGHSSLTVIANRDGQGGQEDPELDLDLSAANELRPGVMAVSFLCDTGGDASLFVRVTGARYDPISVQAGDWKRRWWLRRPVQLTAVLQPDELVDEGIRRATPIGESDVGPLRLSVEVRVRPVEKDQVLLTVCLVNRSIVEATQDEVCLFQAVFEAEIRNADGTPAILPYPSGRTGEDPEDLGLELLYRDHQTFGAGHGCSADWDSAPSLGRVSRVTGNPFPVTEVPNITPEVQRSDGSRVAVSMAALGGLDRADDGMSSLEEVVDLYRTWIEKSRGRVGHLPRELRGVAQEHLERCARAAERMSLGLEYLRENQDAMTAFRLANRAILIQQVRARRTPRTIRFDRENRRYSFGEPYPDPDPLNPERGQGQWRPFQIAFFLMAVPSTAEARHTHRELVELIWFPTGGGKTEAYLGLAAFSMFLRRLRDREDSGVDVLMRYTLRLLTAQQFQRAARLICAMEDVRGRREDLGNTPFSIGIWVGTTTTPNSLRDAVSNLRGLRRNRRSAKDWLVVRQCPWCGAEMGVIHPTRARPWPEEAGRVTGYIELEGGISIHCPDSACRFHTRLPIHLIDEDLYSERPSLVIGTVDKFALLAWNPSARALFGLGADGERISSPPTLILQDELHLISGPLGSMVGLYETLIEHLASDHRLGPRTKPKIVCSTATIRRFSEQIRALYGRTEADLFPPPGLDASDSFFSRFATDSEGNLLPGRLFVGVHAPGLGSVPTAQVRTFASLLQAPVPFDSEERDPWWTLLVFYNSLRELGQALSLLQSDIPDYLKTLRVREDLQKENVRWLNEVQELTGRLRDEEVPQAIELLERSPCSHRYPVDVCVASNIIEVGIDIDRLSIMAVVGQPKTTSQYIQVTGRVGRRWWERPGLVVTIYSPSKPRDRSHFEHFKSYHQRLYAQVEPTSVTPMSFPALLRGLHAVLAGYVRQTGSSDEIHSPYPAPLDALEAIRKLLLERARIVDESEIAELEGLVNRRISEWVTRKRTIWEDRARGKDAPLLHEAGQFIPPGWIGLSWPTPLSMRNVDAECRAVISQLYLLAGDDNE